MASAQEDDFVEHIITAAALHGKESEADHEIGDLQEALRACWQFMMPLQRQAAAREIRENIENWGR